MDEKKQVVKLGLALIYTMRLYVMTSFYSGVTEKSLQLTTQILRLLTEYIIKHKYN